MNNKRKNMDNILVKAIMAMMIMGGVFGMAMEKEKNSVVSVSNLSTSGSLDSFSNFNLLKDEDQIIFQGKEIKQLVSQVKNKEKEKDEELNQCRAQIAQLKKDCDQLKNKLEEVNSEKKNIEEQNISKQEIQTNVQNINIETTSPKKKSLLSRIFTLNFHLDSFNNNDKTYNDTTFGNPF